MTKRPKNLRKKNQAKQTAVVQREHKDRLFRFIFMNKKDLLDCTTQLMAVIMTTQTISNTTPWRMSFISA